MTTSSGTLGEDSSTSEMPRSTRILRMMKTQKRTSQRWVSRRCEGESWKRTSEVNRGETERVPAETKSLGVTSICMHRGGRRGERRASGIREGRERDASPKPRKASRPVPTGHRAGRDSSFSETIGEGREHAEKATSRRSCAEIERSRVERMPRKAQPQTDQMYDGQIARRAEA